MKKIIIINFFAILSIIFFLEFISNFFKLSNLMGIQSGLIYEKDSRNFFKPNSEGVLFNKKVFIDEYGFRVPSKNFKYFSKENIFIMGDSVAFGNGVKEHETFVGLLRKNFKSKNFLNSSVPGHQMKDHVKNILLTKKFKNVEKILYFFTLNDVYNSSNVQNLKDKNNEASYNLKKIKFLNEINAFLRNKSYLYMLIKGIGTDPSKRWFLNVHKKYINDDLTSVEEKFIFLDNFSKDANINFIVIILPYEYQTRNCTENILKPQKKIANILNSNKIIFKDFTNVFCNQKKPKINFYKFDPMHLSRNGHELVYKTLIDEINF